MNKKKVLVWGIIFMMVLQTFSITSYATGTDTAESGGSSNTDLADAALAIMDSNKYMTSPEGKEALAETISLVVAGLKASGYTDEAIAGLCCNIHHESHFDPYSFQGNYNYFEAYTSGSKEWTYKNDVTNSNNEGGAGLCQWTYGRHVQLSDYCKGRDSNCMKVTAVYYTTGKGGKTANVTYLGDAGTQVAYLIQDSAGWIDQPSKTNLPKLTYEGFKTLTNAENAAIYWCINWERPSDMVTKAHDRSKNAQAWLSLVKGNYDWGSYISESQSNALTSQLVSAGYWSEDELSSYMRLVEPAITFDTAKRENLSQEELSGLANWERNINQDLEEGGLINFLRRVVMFFGIVFIVWVCFVYIAYWFDRINNFFYIDLLGILTLGHLHMSDTEKECTFHIRDLGKEGRKTVNHKAILFICIVGVAFGVFIVSGYYYVVLKAFVNFIQRILGSF